MSDVRLPPEEERIGFLHERPECGADVVMPVRDGPAVPEAALGVGTTAPVRLRLLADGPPNPAMPIIAYSYAALSATLPLVLLGLAGA